MQNLDKSVWRLHNRVAAGSRRLAGFPNLKMVLSVLIVL